MKGAQTVGAVTLLLVACGTNVASPTPVPPPALAPTKPPPSASPVNETLPGSNSSPDPQPAVNAVLQDAATHLGVPADQLHVDDVQPRQWPDSSLGCPRPGLLYSQIVTPGFLITVSTTSGGHLEYHTDGRSRVVLCTES